MYHSAMPTEPFRQLGKLLLVIGAIVTAIGVLIVSGVKMPFRLGHLPGDIAYHGRHGSFYFPIVTCIVVSVALTLIFWIINAFRH